MMKTNKTKYLLIGITILFLTIMLIFPLLVVIKEAFSKGIDFYISSITDKYTIEAIKLTLITTVVAIIVNTIFGLFAAWCITKYKFRGNKLLVTLIDIPFAISPVIAGLIYILTFGRMGWAYDFITNMDIKIVFAVPGIILATIFVTFPFISREIIPVLNASGNDEEEAAAIMGASGLKIFTKITFPKIKWALLYGVILCSARAMGEFGAVSVVSGNIKCNATGRFVLIDGYDVAGGGIIVNYEEGNSNFKLEELYYKVKEILVSIEALMEEA